MSNTFRVQCKLTFVLFPFLLFFCSSEFSGYPKEVEVIENSSYSNYNGSGKIDRPSDHEERESETEENSREKNPELFCDLRSMTIEHEEKQIAKVYECQTEGDDKIRREEKRKAEEEKENAVRTSQALSREILKKEHVVNHAFKTPLQVCYSLEL